uniref:Uncharacterized protein n=1 Tax=Opuntia streptacantha TaxID=393608 RepID=A0A7C9CQV0_OPUST
MSWLAHRRCVGCHLLTLAYIGIATLASYKAPEVQNHNLHGNLTCSFPSVLISPFCASVLYASPSLVVYSLARPLILSLTIICLSVCVHVFLLLFLSLPRGGSVGPTVFNCEMHYQFTLCCLHASFFNLYLEEDDWRWPLINCIIAHPYHVVKHGHC